MPHFIAIKSDKFPIQQGEDDELVNEGMYGKALSQYLSEKLVEKGYGSEFYCNEDWGWWVAVDNILGDSGVGIYGYGAQEVGKEYVVANLCSPKKKMNWKRFKFEEVPGQDALIKRLDDSLIAIFEADKDVEILSITDDMPW